MLICTRNKQKCKKEVEITIKVRELVASYVHYVAKKFLATHSIGNTAYYLCLFMQVQFQCVFTFMHAQM